MNRREKILGGALAGAVLAFAGDIWLVDPGLAWYRSVQAQTAASREKIADAQLLLDHRNQIVSDWRKRHGAGLLDDENAARFRAQSILNAAASASGITLESVGGGQRTPALAGQSYDLLRLTLSGQGTLAQVQGFLASIQQAPLPLRIERCEMAARDGRKDQIDLAATLSLRIATADVRGKITLPKKTTAWLPVARSSALDGEVLKAKPFLADRHGDAQPPKHVEAIAEVPAAAPPPPGSDWALVGLVLRNEDGVNEAFLVHPADGREVLAHVGDKVADGQVKTVDAAGLLMVYGQEDRLIQPGSTLAGKPMSLTTARPVAAAAPSVGDSSDSSDPPRSSRSFRSSRSSRSSRDAAAPASVTPAPVAPPAATVSDAEREAILQRLREQRNRTSP